MALKHGSTTVFERAQIFGAHSPTDQNAFAVPYSRSFNQSLSQGHIVFPGELAAEWTSILYEWLREQNLLVPFDQHRRKYSDKSSLFFDLKIHAIEVVCIFEGATISPQVAEARVGVAVDEAVPTLWVRALPLQCERRSAWTAGQPIAMRIHCRLRREFARGPSGRSSSLISCAPFGPSRTSR